jgi:hypothetical protein
MPRYFFDVHHQIERQDTDGIELPDNESAWREATLAAGECLKELDGGFRPGQEWQLKVTDEQRKPIYLIRITAEEK